MNLGLTLLAAAERHGEGEALVDGETRISYAALHERAARLAGGLSERGLERGGRLAVLLRNHHRTVELYWATQWLGARFVPLNFRLSPDEVRYCVTDAQASVVLFEDASARAAQACADDVRGLVDVGEEFDRLLESDPVTGALDLDEDEASLMLYTSGTTGRPKGVPRSHRADRAGGLSQAIHHGYSLGDRALGVMPLYHTMGAHTMIAMALIDGCFVAMPEWDAGAALELIAAERISSLYLAPTLFRGLLDAGADQADLSSVECLGYAGSPMAPELVRRCAEAFAPRVFFNHYGSTEHYTWSIDRNQRAKPGCAGRPAINTRLRLVEPVADAAPDALVEPGQEGQLISALGSDEAFRGYWNRPDADEGAIRDGWYYPGDLARLDEDGDLWVVGRMDDMIISGGENIQPTEVEDVLGEHPAVQEVAVIGVRDERWGQRVVAFVVGEQATERELDDHCRGSDRLAAFKRPREYHFVSELPRSSSGKLLRRALREEIES
ncbi:MAG TPA: AMP-binding protein [Solirubrobacteraceae bacterium]|jgi:2-furoate---CoA ligase|nr:AMP-binding protein [Solirubrobacteraceae bacterium]